MDETQSKVHRYYQATTEDYLRYYQTGWHHHMHYGFDRELPKGGNPTEHMLRYLAKVGGIAVGNTILDAGCGVGGSAIFLARALGCRCVGITLVESQAHLAQGFAATGKAGGIPKGQKTVDERAMNAAITSPRFVVNDFNVPAFKTKIFDVVWAVESFDHAEDKEAWIKAMYALLKPGGRLVIADGFRGRAPLSRSQTNQYQGFLAGWAVPHLCSFQELADYASRAGFEKSHGEDISRDVMPHARAIFRFGLLFIPIRWMLQKIGLTSLEKLGNAYATYYQYRTLKQGLWTYGVFCFRKPG